MTKLQESICEAARRFEGATERDPEFTDSIVVARNVSRDIMQHLPLLNLPYHVKFRVCGDNLEIVALASGPEHSRGVPELTRQVGNWVATHAKHVLTVTLDGTRTLGSDEIRAPDCSVEPLIALEKPSDDGQYRPRFIIELEVEHRSTKSMRSDFARYFESRGISEDGDNVRGVLGITISKRTWAAAAVLWLRPDDQPAGRPVVSGAWLFGISEVGNAEYRTGFERELSDAELPAVPSDLWTCCQAMSPLRGGLYTPRPVVRIPANVMCYRVMHSNPPQPFPTEGIASMEIDLGDILDACYHP